MRVRRHALAVERVLRTVEVIPPGRVAAYGQVGSVAGTGARQTGRILATWGGGVPWWRVTDASGRLPAPLLARARPIWEAEGIPSTPGGLGCAIRRCAADLELLAADARAAWADLPES